MKTAYRLAAVLVATATFIGASAADITCTPGTLGERLGSDAATTATLRITGAMDASDFYFIERNMPALRSLDLANVTIAEYSGTAINGTSRFPAATVPGGIMAGTAFTSLTLPTTPVTLGDMCFAATGVTSVTIPAGTVLGQGAFADSRHLRSVTVASASTGDYTFAGCTSLTTVRLQGTATVGTEAFDHCTALTTVDGSASITAIGANAFRGCTALRDFAFGSALRSIGDGAFAASGLTTADAGASTALATVGTHAFAGCADLTTATFSSAPSFGKGVFMNCRALNKIEMGDDVTIVPDYAFASSGIADGEGMEPAGATEIGRYAYSGSGATSVTLPASLARVGDGAMEGMNNLELIDATALNAVPELGSDVWAGVDQPNVLLEVKEGMGSDFRSADQWQNFHINDMSTASPTITVATGLRGRIVDDVLHIESADNGIASVAVYGVDGTLLVARDFDGSQSAAIALGAIQARLLVVHCTLADGTAATLKLMR